MPTPLDELAMLKAGNRRYVQGGDLQVVEAVARRREDLARGQTPAAVILGCSDSRVPPEMVFDQGLGELFVIRVAGNIATPTQLASVEYAVRELGVRLIVVLGHSGCGAVRATLDVMAGGNAPKHPGLAAIAEAIRPGIAHLPVPSGDSSGVEDVLESLMHEAVDANARASTGRLREGLVGVVPEDGEPVLVVAARYDVETGAVVFIEG